MNLVNTRHLFWFITWSFFPIWILLAQPASISGFVVDSTSGESMISANVYLEDIQVGSTTNAEGYYVIYPIPPGEHELVCHYLGYQLYRKQVRLEPGEKLHLVIHLQPTLIQAQGDTIVAESEAVERDVQISQIKLTTRSIRQAPQLGEADLFRTLQALPGVLSESDFSTGLVVRGGNTDQNLIMLDGITVYNPSHMGGLFSNFLLEAIKDVRFIKGGFPAEYGGRMSAVLNVISKEGNRKQLVGGAAVSMLSSQMNMEIPTGKGALLVAGRRTYFDQAVKLIGEEFPYYFYDFQGSFHQEITPYDRITVSGYFGNDVLNWDDINIDLLWGNRTLSAHWQHVFSPRLFSHFMVAASRFQTSVEFGGDEGVEAENRIRDNTLKGDLTFFLSPQNDIKFGFEVKRLLFQYRSVFDNRTMLRIRQTPVEAAFYVQNSRQLSPRWMMNIGLRMSYFSGSRELIHPEPRLALKYKLGYKEYLNFATGVYRQFIHTVQDEYSPSISNDWFAIDPTVSPGRSYHFVAGYEKHLWGTTFIQIEGYYKILENMLTYRESRSAVDEALGEDIPVNQLFVNNSGRAYGAEIFIHKQYGRLAGWIGYSLGWAKKHLDGDTYYASFDRRHDLSVLFSYELGRRWRFSSRLNYGTGYPYTRALGRYEERDGGRVEHRIIFDEKRNRFRYPAYSRWDVGFTKYFRLLGKSAQFDIQVVNVMNRKNIFFYQWNFEEDQAIREEVTMLPIVPTIGLRINF